MIAAIQRDYTAPPGFADAIKESARAVATKKRIEDMAACLFCDDRGLIRIQSTTAQGQITVRICTHDPQIEAALAHARNFDNIGTMPPDALNGSITNGNMTNEKRPAEPSASP